MAYSRNIDITDPADTDEAKYGAKEIKESKQDWLERFESFVNDVDADPLVFKSLQFKNNAVVLEFQDSGETDPAGNFRILIDADVFKFQGRNATDNGWEDIIEFKRPANAKQVILKKILTLSENAPYIDLTDTGESTPAGKFRLKSDGDQLLIQGRNAADDDYETILILERVADGGTIRADDGYAASDDADLTTKADVDALIATALANATQLKFLASPANKVNWTAATGWTDVDISANTGADTAKAALLNATLIAGTTSWGQMTGHFRKNGSSDTANLPRITTKGAVTGVKLPFGNSCMMIVQCDGSEIFETTLIVDEGSMSSISYLVDLIGYFV